MKSSRHLVLLPLGLGLLGLGYFFMRPPTRSSLDTGLEDVGEVQLVAPDKEAPLRVPVPQEPGGSELQDPEPSQNSTPQKPPQKNGPDERASTKPEAQPETKPAGQPVRHVAHTGKQELVGGILNLYHGEGPAIAESGPFENGKRQGYWESFTETGVVIARGSYKDNLTEGLWEGWYADGNPSYRSQTVAGKRQGPATYWLPTGEIDESRSGNYVNDVLEKPGQAPPQEPDPNGPNPNEPNPNDPGEPDPAPTGGN